LLAEYRDLLAGCKAKGFSVESQALTENVAWGFFDQHGGPDEARPVTQRLLSATRDWLRRQFP
jgi:hypothetical protein